VVSKYQRLFEMGSRSIFTLVEEALGAAVARKAIEPARPGARGPTLESWKGSLLDTMFDLPSLEGVEEVRDLEKRVGGRHPHGRSTSTPTGPIGAGDASAIVAQSLAALQNADPPQGQRSPIKVDQHDFSIGNSSGIVMHVRLVRVRCPAEEGYLVANCLFHASSLKKKKTKTRAQKLYLLLERNLCSFARWRGPAVWSVYLAGRGPWARARTEPSSR